MVMLTAAASDDNDDSLSQILKRSTHPPGVSHEIMVLNVVRVGI